MAVRKTTRSFTLHKLTSKPILFLQEGLELQDKTEKSMELENKIWYIVSEKKSKVTREDNAQNK